MKHPMSQTFAALFSSGFMEAIAAHAAASSTRDLALANAAAAEDALATPGADASARREAEARAAAAREALASAEAAPRTAAANLGGFTSPG